jgi:hypothetical protein
MNHDLGVIMLALAGWTSMHSRVVQSPNDSTATYFKQELSEVGILQQVDIIRAARVALLAIRVTAKGTTADPLQGYTLLPDTAVLDASETVRRLASLPKPVACRGEIRDQVLRINCASIRDPAQIEQHQADILGFEAPDVGFIAMMRRQEPRALDLMLVVGVQDHELVDSAVFLRWYTDYVRQENLSMGMRPPTVEEGALGATSVLLLHRNEQGDG